ncbi:hypothetical protein H4696_008462 [Amycolatopsis lexingtonensis]|uniref:Helix-turn-helix domain-containing protein n=1 Tax=Amycolatopsis lexingtonensis TaxID=218822 RepID=A0ABR9IDU9_9PSEU|nr:hypothetical protein [Amycolatopsis lexingtonensis]
MDAETSTPWLTPREAADWIRCHKDTILRACREWDETNGKSGLKSEQRVRNGRRKIHRDDLERWAAGKAPTRGRKR